MKIHFISRSAGFIFIVFCQIAACTSPQSSVTPASNTVAYREDTLNGERVLIPFNVPKEAFDFTLFFQGTSNARLDKKKLPTLEAISKIAGPYVDKYPDLS